MNGREAMEVLAERAEYLAASMQRWPHDRRKRFFKRERRALRMAVAALAEDEEMGPSVRAEVWTAAAKQVAANQQRHADRVAAGELTRLIVDVPADLVDALGKLASASDMPIGALVALILGEAATTATKNEAA